MRTHTYIQYTHTQHINVQACKKHMQEHTHANPRHDSFVSMQKDTNTEHRTIHECALGVHLSTTPTTNQQQTNLCLLRLALLLTEDNHLRTASPCCLALCVSACLRLSKCTQRATVDHWKHHPRPVLQPAVTDECPHTVWLSDQSVWVTKTGPGAESGPVNCHFLLSGYSLSCLFDPSTVYLTANSPPYTPICFSTCIWGQLNKTYLLSHWKSSFWATSSAPTTLNHWKVSASVSWSFRWPFTGFNVFIFISSICSYNCSIPLTDAYWGSFEAISVVITQEQVWLCLAHVPVFTQRILWLFMSDMCSIREF